MSMLPLLRTALTERLGIAHPLLLAPMAGVSGGRLAAAVSRAGGLGIVGGGYGDADWLDAQMALAGDAPVGIGFITWALQQQPQLLARALAWRPRAVFLSFGAIDRFAAEVRDGGALLIAQVQTLAQAREAAAQGADLIVAQGSEAGGHGGRRATLPLVPAVVDAVAPLPVLAAGGIADGRGLAAALMLGAAGAVCGTAFYVAEESLAHPQAKRAAVAGEGDATWRSTVFDAARDLHWPPDWDLRALRNRFSDRWEAAPEALRADVEARRHYAAAREAGDTDTAAVIVGEAADLVHAVQPAAAIVEAIVHPAARRIAEASASLPPP